MGRILLTRLFACTNSMLYVIKLAYVWPICSSGVLKARDRLGIGYSFFTRCKHAILKTQWTEGMRV